MNGISRKAVLLGLDRSGRPREQPDTKVIPPSTTESSSEEIPSDFPVFIETSSGSQLIPLNVSYDQLRKTLETLEEIHKDSNKVYNLTSSLHNNETSQANSIQWFYPRQRNSSKPVLIQSLTKSNAYVDLNYVKISGLNSSASSGPAATAASLVNKTITLVGEENPEALFLRIFNTSDNRPLNASDTMAKAIAAKLLQQSTTTTTTPAPRQLPPMVAIPPPPRAASDGPDGAEDEELDEDERARQEWGGECTVADWKSCYNITVMGLPTKVHPLYPNDRKKNIRTQLNCFDTNEALDFPWLCLRNRWTVNRCHILCMSKCNRGGLIIIDFP